MSVGYVQRELDQIAVALRSEGATDRYRDMYIVQQALSWALDPSMFKPPMKMLEEEYTSLKERAPLDPIPPGAIEKEPLGAAIRRLGLQGD